MPIYGQRCPDCGHEFDDFRHMAESAVNPDCPVCGATTARVLSMPAVQVGGSVENADDSVRKHYGLKPGERCHQNYMTGEVLKFDRLDSETKIKERIRQSYIKAGVKGADDPGSVKTIK